MSQDPSPSRPAIAGATSDSSRDSSFNGRHQSDAALPQSGLGPSKRNASVACLNCKSAKRKCDQDTPCSNCRNTSKDCVYDASQDGRRKEVRKRRLDELEFRSNALDRLLLKLRNSSYAEARELIDLIKRDAPLEDILEFIKNNPGEIADETRRALSASPPPPEGAGIRRMLAISELIDMPPFQVEADPWTAVTSDNALVSHLLSAYYGWYHFHYLNFDWELFIAALKAKDLNSPYCSPLLVNAVLGMGCMFSDHPSALAVSGDSETRGQHFFNEAQRLYELEGDRLTLTNVQGFTILIMLAAFAGKDRISSVSLKKLETMVPEFLAQYDSSNSEQQISPELQKSLEIVEWAAYIYLTGFGISFMGPPTWSKPRLKRPYESNEWKTHLTPWSPYPLNQEPINIPQHTLCDDLSLAYCFMGDVQSLLFVEFPKLNAVQKFEAAQELDRQNQIWYNSLPAAHRFDRPDFIIVPGTVDLALAILFSRLFLWNWTTPPASVTTNPPEEDVRHESDPSRREKSDAERVQEVRTMALATCAEIVDNVVSLGRRFDDQYGPTYHSMLTPQSSIFCANFLLMGNLNSAHEEGLLLEIMKILVQSSKRWQLVKGVTHMLLKGAEEKVKGQPSPLVERDDEQPIVPIPGQLTQEVFESMDLIVRDMAWSPSDYLHFSSRYPNYLVAKEDPTVELSNMLEQWAQLALDEIGLREAADNKTEPVGHEGSNDDNIAPEEPPVHSIEHEDVPMSEAEEPEKTSIAHELAGQQIEESNPREKADLPSTAAESSGQDDSTKQQNEESAIDQPADSEPVAKADTQHAQTPEVEAGTSSGSNAAAPVSEGQEGTNRVEASTVEAGAGEQATTEDQMIAEDVAMLHDTSETAEEKVNENKSG